VSLLRLQVAALPFPLKLLFLRSVRTVSNLLRLGRPGGAGTEEQIAIRPALDGEVDAALRLVVPARERGNLVQTAEFARLADVHRHSSGGFWVAVAGDSLRSAVLPIISPGRTMLLFPPADPRTPIEQAAAQALIEVICQQAAGEGVHLAQSLLEPSAAGVQSLLAGCGFGMLAELLYLQAGIQKVMPLPVLPCGHRLETYSEARHAQFAHVLLASYHQSLDCPALNGIRHSDDILASHRATGEHDPRLWHLLSVGGSAAAMLLLARIPRTRDLELVYLGVAAEARGRGIGDLLMRQAMAVASTENCARLSLAVDAANFPALRLYWRHGMQAIGRKLVMFKDLRAGASG
jgi:ribosomal protein S18 acetylase RimI-like enzyme